MRARQVSRVLYISVAHALIHTIEFTYAALLSRIDSEFGAGLFVLGIAANGFAFMFGFSALPSGVLVDRLGTKRVLIVAFSIAAVAALLVAIAPNVWLLGLFLALLGLGIGLYHPAGLAFIAQATSQRGMALGWHGVAGNLGIAVTPLLAVGVAEAADWRWAYVVLAVLALVVALALRFMPEPEELPAAVEPESAPEPPDPPPEALAAGARTLTRAERWRPYLPLFLVYGVFVLNGFIYRGSLTFLPVHIEERLHVSWFGLDEAWLASSLITLALLAGAAGQLFGGALSDRFRLERLALPLTFSLLPFLVLIGLTSGLPLVLFAALFVFADFSSQPIYTGLIADYAPANAIGRSYGVSFFAAFGIGSLAATFAGFIAERWGTDAVFLSLAGVVTITISLAAAIWWLAEQSPRERPGGSIAGR